MNTKIEKSLLIGMLSIFMLCGMLCASTYAFNGEYSYEGNYNYEGFPLETIENGTVQGDVYVSYGDNAGLQGTSYECNTFVTTFSNVPTSGIKWAEVKFGVWGGSTSRVGWAEAELEGQTLSNETLQADSTVLSNNVSCCGSGVYMVYYNCTDQLQNNDGTITLTVNTTPGSPALDGRVYGAVLIVVYESGDYYTQYWINQGPVDLHKSYTGHPHNNANITWFYGCPYNFGDANLTVGYFAGDYGQNDYLYFNVPDEAGSPYNFDSARWNINNYVNYQLDENDVANENDNTTSYFDLHTFSVTGLVNHSCNSNYAIFWRGHNDTYTSDDIYDPPYPQVNPETESYYVPFLAVLTLHNVSTYDFSNYTEGVAGVDHHAYGDEASSLPPSSSEEPDNEFSALYYAAIAANDNIPAVNLTNKYASHRFTFNVTDNASVISAINVTWKGTGIGFSDNGANLYIWNYSASAYEKLDGYNEVLLPYTLLSGEVNNPENYINNNQVIVLAEQKSNRILSSIATDYVKLVLLPKNLDC